MKDKYYTPDISEFHVGFEYEYKSFDSWRKTTLEEEYTHRLDGDSPTDTEWNPFAGWQSLEGIFRVKYFDGEDVESLGWEQEHILDWDGGFLAGYSFSVEQDRVDTYYLYFNNEKICIYSSYCYDENSGNTRCEFLFKGNIKNKSELKKLMKQLSIQ